MSVTGTVKRDVVGAVVGALTEWDPPNVAAGGNPALEGRIDLITNANNEAVADGTSELTGIWVNSAATAGVFADLTNDELVGFTMTGGDLSTWVEGAGLVVTAFGAAPYGPQFTPDGTRFFYFSADALTMVELTVVTPFVVSNIVAAGNSSAVFNDASYGGEFTDDGSMFFFISGDGLGNAKIRRKTLSTAYDVTELGDTAFDVGQDIQLNTLPGHASPEPSVTMELSSDGHHLYLTGDMNLNESEDISHLYMSTAFDLTTLEYSDTYVDATIAGDMLGVSVNYAAGRAYSANTSTPEIDQWAINN